MDKLTAYKILGLKRGAELEAVREAYKTLVQDIHPEEDPERFSEVQSAYRYLLRQNSGKSRPAVKDIQYREPANVQFDASGASDVFDSPVVTNDNFHIANNEESSELVDLFEDVSVKTDAVHSAELRDEADRQTIDAIRQGSLHVKAISPEYLAQLLKTYPLTKKEYKKLYAEFSGMKQEDDNKLMTDITRPKSFAIKGALWFFASLFIVLFVEISLGIDVDDESTDVMTFTMAVILTAIIMLFSYRRAKKKKLAELPEEKVELLSEVYAESISIVKENMEIVPESRKEIYISCAAAAVNMIPFELSIMPYFSIVNIGLALLYYALRKQMPKNTCGLMMLFCEISFQFIAFMAIYNWDYKKYIALTFLLINLGLIIYMTIKSFRKNSTMPI